MVSRSASPPLLTPVPHHPDIERPAFDWLILTAANESQAAGYRAQLRERHRLGRLHHCAHWLVLADPRGKRAGSGGATLLALAALADRLSRRAPARAGIAALFEGVRVLILHCGGDSRRLPAYAAQGKIFAPIPHNAGVATLFDLILDDFSRLDLGSESRVIVASGDVLLNLHHSNPRILRPGLLGLAFAGSPSVGGRHGVYVRGPSGETSNFLQKPHAAALRRARALLPDGRVLIDTGVLVCDPTTVESMLRATGLLRRLLAGASAPIDLYEHVIMAAVRSLDQREYLRRITLTSPTAPTIDRADITDPLALRRSLQQIDFGVAVVPHCDFLHVGSTPELLHVWSKASPRTAVINTIGRISGAGRSLIDGCVLDNPVSLRGDNLVVGIQPRTPPFMLPRGVGMSCVPVGRSDWCTLLFSIRDDFKSDRDRAVFLGHRLRRWLADHDLTESDLWPHVRGERSLFTARLWPVGTSRRTIELTRWMLTARESPPAAWRRSPRLSMHDLLRAVNQQRLIEHHSECARRWRLDTLPARLNSDNHPAADDLISDLHTPAEAREALRAIAARLKSDTRPLSRARLYWLAHEIRRRFPRLGRDSLPKRPDDAAFDAVSIIVRGQRPHSPPPARASLRPDQLVRVEVPARIDLAGGWSDTPPICHELGGAVVNAAVTLNGQCPIQVTARLTDAPHIRITSLDLGRSVVLRDSRDVLRFDDPRHWAALPKAALVLTGIAPSASGESLAHRLRRFGAGLELTTFSALPKGSGLGTSSILGAALLACLGRVVGLARIDCVGAESLIQRTSTLEQMTTTGGGWQDQAGGILPGVKLLTTHPGPLQVPTVRPLHLDLSPTGPLGARTLLYDTGYQRLAANILRQVVGGFLARSRRTLDILDRLKAGAHRAAAAITERNDRELVSCIAGYWRLKQAIDPGATTPHIERLIDPVRHLLAAHELPGAGGGGFALMIAHDEHAAARVRRILNRRPPNARAGFCEFGIDEGGIRISTV